MCGLAALFEAGRAFDLALLADIEAGLYNRGPDAGAVAAEPGWALAFRRLAILDPTLVTD